MPSPPLWGELPAGPYPVGFQSFIAYDYSRRYDLHSTQPGAATPRLKGRPIVVQVWYPAQPPEDTATMPYEAYLTVSSPDDSLQAFVEQLNRFTREAERRWSGLDAADTDAFQRFLQTPTGCYLNAPPLDGSYPAVIYHQGLGGSIVDNPVLLEFLASHGYVVATSAYPPEHGLWFGVDSDLNRSIKDMACVINALGDRYGVDPARIGLIGHSYGASAVLAYAAEAQANVGAVVSLDSTREWNPAYDHLYRNIAERLSRAERFSVPLMIFSKVTPTVTFEHYETLSHADRYYVTVQHLGHNDFVTPGPTASTLAGDRVDEQEPLIRSTSQVVCQSVLAFLNAYLKEEPNSENLMATLHALDRDSQALAVQERRAEPVAIAATSLLELFLHQDAEAGCQRIAQDVSQVTTAMLMQVGRALQERGLHGEAIALYQAINHHFPEFAKAHETLGDLYHYTLKDKPSARAAYQAALEALPRDVTLSGPEQDYLRHSLSEDIETLTGE
ncbi:alpha/beta fold hydrolase [Nodosilinea sp. AN01ver1]|uniref:alpha/beta hydrolase family protein n=1 Tax=Nodosilinea sp. AN01ver1 TaxID=3423362 RepID=UPI003D320119